MKIRQGFVTNSSSSSFIVVFDQAPKSAKEVQELLFGPNSDGTKFGCIYDNTSYPVEDVAETVWNDIQNQQPNDVQAILNEMSGERMVPYGHFEQFLKDDKNNDTDFRKKWELEDRLSTFAGMLTLDTFISEHQGKLFYIFEYGDDNGNYEASLEHGDLFKRLPHKTYSKH